MALISRIKRLLKADVHAVIDELEDPLVILKQALRDMEASIIQLQQQVQHVLAEETFAMKKIAELQASTSFLDEELTLCLEQNNDELAKTVIRKQLTVKYRIEKNQLRLGDLREEKETLNIKLKEQEQLFESTKQEAELLYDTQQKPNTLTDPQTISQSDVEIALLKAKAARS